jgi:hypothetical protein
VFTPTFLGKKDYFKKNNSILTENDANYCIDCTQGYKTLMAAVKTVPQKVDMVWEVDMALQAAPWEVDTAPREADMAPQEADTAPQEADTAPIVA